MIGVSNCFYVSALKLTKVNKFINVTRDNVLKLKEIYHAKIDNSRRCHQCLLSK